MHLTLGQQIRLQSKILRVYTVKIFSWRSIQRIVAEVFDKSDTTTIRIVLANASMLWAFMLITRPTQMEFMTFDIMRAVGGTTFWTVAFLLHFAGVYWRAYDSQPGISSGLIVNGYGFLLWFFTTVSTNYYAGNVTPGTALEIVICGGAAWALYKTGSTGTRQSI